MIPNAIFFHGCIVWVVADIIIIVSQSTPDNGKDLVCCMFAISEAIACLATD
jgi:hypothetical protein